MNLITAFHQQAETCGRMGSPFMGRLLNILADNWSEKTALGQVFATYRGDIGPAGHSLPLRLAGGLHALVLSGQDPDLAAVYPPHDPDDTTLTDAVMRALSQHEAFLLDWTQSAPQTNEVRRSAALIAGAHVAHAHFPRPIVLSELGASGGLNLNWDRYGLQIGDTRLGPDDPVLSLSPDWTGALPPLAGPNVVERAGVDLNPLDPQKADDHLRLSSYLWPDQPERMRLTKAAASIQNTAIHKGDAIDWLEQRLARPQQDRLHLIQHTVAWQYFPADAQDRGRALIEAAGEKATENSALAWLQMETDGDTTGGIGAALVLRLWPGNLTLNLGRADFHGRWVQWHYATT